ncbi:hypothetical protein MPC4_110073 [Methylocella tundrae]|uniref:Uncharacterized protein n=1 Tax=Methylocella tundrae TaxID=227605 RepID=A0A8B6M330_METTU|nr:hypothetical protein MPC1_4860005 [Methylocella tundrae]VTZ48773.1 hypothetical protein MPC4_110073 [Methylocella tundrae]
MTATAITAIDDGLLSPSFTPKQTGRIRPSYAIDRMAAFHIAGPASGLAKNPLLGNPADRNICFVS